MKDIFSLIRKIGLAVMIIGGVICELILLWCHQWWWAGYWGIAVLGGVALVEIISYAVGKKTISTRWQEWAEVQPVWAYSALTAMAIAFLGLIVHLAFWGGMFGK